MLRFRELKHALDETFESVFEGQDPGQAIDGMKLVLRMVAYPNPNETPDRGEVERAEHFFTVFLHNLQV